MGCHVHHIIKDTALTEAVRFKRGDTPDIVTTIMEMDKVSDKWVDPEGVQCLRGADDYDTMHRVWKFVKNNLTYKPDRPGREVVKSPGALFRIGRGDCKSFSIATAAILRRLGYKNVRFRFVSYAPDMIVSHVYIVVKIKGEDVIMDSVHSTFDTEDSYTYKKDIRAAAPAAIGAIPRKAPTQSNKFNLIGAALVLYGLL